MRQQMFNRRKFISTLLLSAFTLSLISTCASIAWGRWTQVEYYNLISPTVASDQYGNHSVAISPLNQTIHIVFLSDGLIDDYILYQTSEKQDLQDYTLPLDYEQLNNITGNDVQTEVANPDIAVDWNGIAHVVYEGVQGSTRYIYYTNNSLGTFTNYTKIDSTASDQTNPSIVCSADGKVHIFYYRTGSGLQYARSENSGASFAVSSSSPFPAAGNDNPDAVITNISTTDQAIYLITQDSTSLVVRYARSTSWDSWTSVPLGAAIGNNPKIDAIDNFAAFTFWNSSGVHAGNITDMTTVGEVQLVSTIHNQDPAIVMDRYAGVSVFYSRDVRTISGHTHQGIFLRNNRDSATFGFEDEIATDTSANGLGEASYKRDPAVARLNDTVVVVYSCADFDGGNVQSFKTYITGFLNFYSQSSNQYSQLRVGEDPKGVYLFEALTLSYNSTVDYDVNITITDNASGLMWSNVTKLPKNGGTERRVPFYNFENLFLSDSFYWITIKNATPEMKGNLAKFAVDFTRKVDYEVAGDPLQYYITEATGVDGALSDFKIGVEWQWWEDRENLDDGRLNLINGKFSSDNFADFYKLDLYRNIVYNLTVAETSSSEKLEVRLYNSSVRITNSTNALFTLNTATGNALHQTFTVNHTSTKTESYYVMVLRENCNPVDLPYSIFYESAPYVPTIILPADGSCYASKTVQLSWVPNSADEGKVKQYDVQVDTVDTFDSVNLRTIVCSGETNKTYNFTSPATAIWYYWRVRVVSTYSNVGPWSTTRHFGIDTMAPAAPVVDALNIYYNTGSFFINWTVPADGPFTPDHYSVYMSTKSGFACNTQTRLPSNYTSHSMYTNALTPGYYYFKVTATDKTGNESLPSNEVQTVVVSGRYFNATQQRFSMLAGDYIEYEVINVISETTTGGGVPLFEYGYTGWVRTYQVGDRFHFWIKSVSRSSVTPVVGDFYAKQSGSTVYELITQDYSLVPFVASTDSAFMQAVADAYMAALMPEVSGTTQTFSSVSFIGTFQNGLQVLDTVTFTYNGIYTYNDDEQTTKVVRASLQYDASTGVLVELTSYNEVTGIGYTLRIADTTAQFTPSWKTWAPIFFIVGILTLAGVAGMIIRKVEYR